MATSSASYDNRIVSEHLCIPSLGRRLALVLYEHIRCRYYKNERYNHVIRYNPDRSEANNTSWSAGYDRTRWGLSVGMAGGNGSGRKRCPQPIARDQKVTRLTIPVSYTHLTLPTILLV